MANHSLSDLRRALTPTGTLVPNGGGFDNHWFASGGRVVSAHVLSRFVSHRPRPFLVSPNLEDLIALKELKDILRKRPSGAVAAIGATFSANASTAAGAPEIARFG